MFKSKKSLNYIASLFKNQTEAIEFIPTIVTTRAYVSEIKGNTLSFINESDKTQPTIFEDLGNEEAIVEMLSKNKSFKTLLYRELFDNYEDIKIFTSLKEPFTSVGKKPGDIDLLLVDEPSKTIAFECKIVKISSIYGQDPKLNKIKALGKGVVQANKYLELGFHKVYLMIILVEDGRQYERPNFIFNTATKFQLESLYEGTWQENIHQNIGIMYLNFTQVLNKPVLGDNVMSLDIRKRAIGLTQKKDITKKVEKMAF